jgi:transposase
MGTPACQRPIDEISYKRGQRYLTVVVDHDSGRLVWAAPRRERATEALDDVRRQAWNAARRQPGSGSNRIRWSRGRIRQDAAGTAKALKHARYALWKNPENLTTR